MDQAVKVAVVQAASVFFDLEKSIAKAIALIEEAAAAGASLALFPEAFLGTYPRGLSFGAAVGSRTPEGRQLWEAYYRNTVDLDGPSLQPLQAAIARAGLFVAMGAIERGHIDGSLYCSLLYFAPDGRLLGSHRKLKPTGTERVIWGEGDGRGLIGLRTAFGRISGLICWENLMPAARMALYRRGVDLYLAPTADSRAAWQHSLRHIALEGRCFVLGCNQYYRGTDYPEALRAAVSAEGQVDCRGGSVIVGPDGEALVGPLWDQEGILYADLDPSLLLRSYLDFDPIGHYHRPDVFHFDAPAQPEWIDCRGEEQG
ncbi:MAG: carbon-nitrogen hydrolase family protein [Bacteroidota bacterium]